MSSDALTCGTCGKDLNAPGQWLVCRAHFTDDIAALRVENEQLRKERDEARGYAAQVSVALARIGRVLDFTADHLIGRLRAATARAERAEAERDERVRRSEQLVEAIAAARSMCVNFPRTAGMDAVHQILDRALAPAATPEPAVTIPVLPGDEEADAVVERLVRKRDATPEPAAGDTALYQKTIAALEREFSGVEDCDICGEPGELCYRHGAIDNAAEALRDLVNDCATCASYGVVGEGADARTCPACHGTGRAASDTEGL